MKDVALFLDTLEKVEKFKSETGIDNDIILKIVEPSVELTYESVLDFFKKKKEEISKIEFDKIKSEYKSNLILLENNISLLKKYVGKDVKKFTSYDKKDEDWWMDANDDLYKDTLYKLFDMVSLLENNNTPSGDKLNILFKGYEIEIHFNTVDKVNEINDMVKRNNYNKYLGNEIYRSTEDLKKNNISDIFMVLYDNKEIVSIMKKENRLTSDIEDFNKDEYLYIFNDSENPNYEDYEKYLLSLNKNNIGNTLSNIIKYIEQTKKDINSFNSILNNYQSDSEKVLKDIKEDNFKEINQKYKYIKDILECYQDLLKAKIHISKKFTDGIMRYYK